MKKYFLLFASLVLQMSAYAQHTVLKGDMNGDGKLTVDDVAITTSMILGKQPMWYLSVESQWQGNPQTFDYVDLGLTSGTLWATCNVGASAPEDFGTFLAWGETKPKTSYSWATYTMCTDGNQKTISKYTRPDNQTTSSWYVDGNFVGDGVCELLCDDDAAFQERLGKWRTPSREMWQELIDECTWTWTTIGQVSGCKVTGTNQKWIFLPAAGIHMDTGYTAKGSWGRYMSSSLSENSTNFANFLFFASSGAPSVSTHPRCYGRTVRPVIPGRFVKAIGIRLNTENVDFALGETFLLKAAIQPSAVTNKSLVWRSSDPTVATVDATGLLKAVGLGTCTVTCTTTDGSNISVGCEVSVANVSYSHAVDLGLSVLWADMNVEGLFTWGDTEKKTNDVLGDLAWSDYKWTDLGTWQSISKYTFDDRNMEGIWYFGNSFIGDNKKALDPADDVAHVLWGGEWRMPTKEEFEELLTSKWIRIETDCESVCFTNVASYDCETIRLSMFSELFDNAGMYESQTVANYWTRTLSSKGSKFACCMKYLPGLGEPYMSYSSRCNAYAIRPVCDKKVKK